MCKGEPHLDGPWTALPLAVPPTLGRFLVRFGLRVKLPGKTVLL